MNKLLKLSEFHYIVVDDSKRGYRGYNYNFALSRIDNLSSNYKEHTSEWNCCYKITHSTQPLIPNTKGITVANHSEYLWGDIKPISLSEVEEAIYGYSVEKMAMSYLDRNYSLSYERTTWQKLHEKTFEAGFNAHKELVKDKLSINQVIDFYNWLKKSYGSVKPLEEAQIIHRTTPDKIVEMYLQTLKEQTEWNIEFDQNGKIIVI